MKKINELLMLALMLITLFFTACNPTTNPELLPVLTTHEVTDITQFSAVSGGSVSDDRGASVTARGVCWSTKANPTVADNKTTDGVGIGWFTSNITGLTAGTTYWLRAYATSSAGTGYGSSYQITTSPPNVTDINGNVYHTVMIGNQVWMVENLKTTKYKDGTAIPNVTDNNAWSALSTPAYCWYNNDAATYKSTYGALYNWYAVNTGKLAPAGWHVATDAEWTKLAENYRYTFSVLPVGFRKDDGTFDYLEYHGYWWTATANGGTGIAWGRDREYDYDRALNKYDNTKTYGFSVLCVKD